MGKCKNRCDKVWDFLDLFTMGKAGDSLTFKKRGSYSTRIASVLTILAFLFLLYYAIQVIVHCVQRKQINTTYSPNDFSSNWNISDPTRPLEYFNRLTTTSNPNLDIQFGIEISTYNFDPEVSVEDQLKVI